jgi:hypothetical protein
MWRAQTKLSPVSSDGRQPRAALPRLTLNTTRTAGAVQEDAVAPLVAVAVLRLVRFDPEGVASGSEPVARAEAAALLARMGASVSWRHSSSNDVIRGGEVWVTLLGSGPQPASGPLVLGATARRDGLAPVVWVRVPNVRAAVGISRTRSFAALMPLERLALGVALGRVIAHEVVHARVPAVPHGSGLMSGTLTRRQLTAEAITFEPEVAFALQAALRGDPVIAPPGAGSRIADAQASVMY